MPAGTIALTNNSTAVTGSGTTFNTELKANDFIVVVVGGVTYTLGVLSVNSATSVTLVSAYGGPAISGAAWTAVPNAALVGITAQVAADVAKAIRGLNQDKVNWQQVFSAAGNITVNLPDGSSFTGPSWGYMTTLISSRASSSDPRFDTINNKTGGTVSGGVNAGAASPSATPPTGTTTNGSGISSRFTSGIYNGVLFSSYVQCIQGSGTKGILQLSYGANTYWSFNQDGSANGVSWVPSSDERLKDMHGPIEEPLEKMRLIRGQTWNRKDTKAFGIGFTAQDVQKVFPDSVSETGDVTLPDGTKVERALAPDVYGVSAGLHHEAILALMAKIEKQDVVILELQNRLKAVDGLDA